MHAPTPTIRRLFSQILFFAILLSLIIAIAAVSYNIYSLTTEPPAITELRHLDLPDWISPDLIKIDGASRRGIPLEELNGIVIHYIGNPGTGAQNNRNYFNNPDSTVSAHFIVGLDGEVIQCIPLHERSSASNHRNSDTISIEVCHPDESGIFNDITYQALVRLTAWLCAECHLDETQIIRHYDVTGKVCPKWFVDDETAWATFKADVMAARN
jgi:N-acetylmuramoyl-L-alanine amidase